MNCCLLLNTFLLCSFTGSSLLPSSDETCMMTKHDVTHQDLSWISLYCHHGAFAQLLPMCVQPAECCKPWALKNLNPPDETCKDGEIQSSDWTKHAVIDRGMSRV